MMGIKLKMLWLYSGSFADWYREVWSQDEDAQMCCDGRMCGCYGSTYGDMWQHLWNHRSLWKNHRKRE